MYYMYHKDIIRSNLILYLNHILKFSKKTVKDIQPNLVWHLQSHAPVLLKKVKTHNGPVQKILVSITCSVTQLVWEIVQTHNSLFCLHTQRMDVYEDYDKYLVL